MRVSERPPLYSQALSMNVTPRSMACWITRTTSASELAAPAPATWAPPMPSIETRSPVAPSGRVGIWLLMARPYTAAPATCQRMRRAPELIGRLTALHAAPGSTAGCYPGA